jgi:hypothetical protein
MTTSMREALFPEPVQQVDGTFISDDAADNLDGAIIDLERQGADAVCIRTLKRVYDQLCKARAALSSPAPDRLSEEERAVVAQTYGQLSDDRWCYAVPNADAEKLLAIIDRLSHQPEAEPVAFIDDATLDDFKEKGTSEYPRHGVVANHPIGPKKIGLYTSPRLDRERLARIVAEIDDQAIREILCCRDVGSGRASIVHALADAIMREMR